MSLYAISGATTHTYETLKNEDASDLPRMNNLLSPPHPYFTPQPAAHNVSPATQQWNLPPEVSQWILGTVVPQNTDSPPHFFKTFRKGKPKALGIVMIVAATLQILLGIGMFFTSHFLSLFSGISFWGSLFYIIAGSLTIGAQAKPNICLVKGSLALNIISILVSCVVLILNGIDLAILRCDINYYSSTGVNYFLYTLCQQKNISGYALHGLLILINLLLFCVFFSVSIFGCRSLSHVPSNITQVFVIQKDALASMNPSTVPTTSQLPPPPQPPPQTRIVRYVNAV
ncbi:membrane-spanning 4-domains subfamily A member 4A-like [Mixophyes fleayi]|uniref:membrane-spanning 4-domains subfamily A member 4A-like n=1 Tax=Mixophyes fleayi TaxID=3061075 RepID=UPI003F4D91F2